MERRKASGVLSRAVDRGERRGARSGRHRTRKPPTAGRRVATVIAAAGVVALIGFAVLVLRRSSAGEAGDLVFPPWPASETAPVAYEDFAGAQACAECHAAQYAAWSHSTHGRAGGEPADVRLLAPFDGSAIRFRDANVTPRRRGDRFEFVISQPDREVRVLPVDGVVGGGHMVGGGTQGFVTRHDDGSFRFLPFELARAEGVWFCNSNTRAERGWVPITPDMALADCGDWPPVRVLGENASFATCQNCHGSQFEVSPRPGRANDTRFATLAIDCESCHGPAARHVELARSDAVTRQSDIGVSSLATLSTDRALEVCFRCHALKDALQPGWLAGNELREYYSVMLPLVGDTAIFADGRIRTFAYQQGHLWSDCYRNGSMTCVDCHEPHAQDYRDVTGRALRGRFDDGQCTACHASKAVEPELHTHHAADSEGSRCVACHMPYLQEPEVGRSLRYARSDHTIPVPRPAFDASLGVEVACQLCHRDASVQDLEAQVRDWWGELKPHPPAVASLSSGKVGTRSPAALLEIAIDTAARHTPARFIALGELLTMRATAATPLQANVIAQLRSLSEDADDDIAAAALAVLHHDRGEDRNTRRFLLAAISRMGPRERAVRARWAVLLGYLGDQHRKNDDPRAAIASYRKALEVRPDDPATLLSLGLAYAQARELDTAEQAYIASLRLQPVNSLALVNLGITRNARGDAAGAAEAYRRAIEVAPTDPLPHFNLGNMSLRADDATQAIQHYRRATELDPSLAPAYFNLARAYIALQEFAAAQAALRRGLEFDAGNAEARNALLQLEASPDPRARE